MTEEAVKKSKISKKKLVILSVSFTVLVGLCIMAVFVFAPLFRYNYAVSLFKDTKYEESQEVFSELGDYSESADYIEKCENEIKYIDAGNYFNEQNYEEALIAYNNLQSFRDSITKAELCQKYIDYNEAKEVYSRGDYTIALPLFENLQNIEESIKYIDQIQTNLRFNDLTNSQFNDITNNTFSDFNPEYINVVKDYNKYSYMADMVRSHINKYCYAYVVDKINNNYWIKPDSIKSALDNITGGYEQSKEIRPIIEAVINKDYEGIIKSVNEYSKLPHTDLKLYQLLDFIGRQGDTVDERLMSYNTYRQLRRMTPDIDQPSLEAMIQFKGIEVDSKIYSQCGKKPAGKVLVVYDGRILTSAMDFLPDKLIPRNLAEVEYVINVKYRNIRRGVYTSGTRAIQEAADVRIVKFPSKKVVKKIGTVKGRRPPRYFYYYGYAPQTKSGGAPNGSKIENLIEKAVKAYIKYKSSGGYVYYTYNNEITIRKYKGKSLTPVVPDKINGIPVTRIESNAFKGHEKIKSITLPKGLKCISGLFSGFSSLTEITLPENVTRIEGAFCNCTSLKTVNFNSSLKTINAAFSGCPSLTEINIPEGVTSISSGAFEGDTNLVKVNIPGNLTKIESNCFKGCTSLTELILPEGIKTIENSAFEGCTNLSKINLPSSLESIGDNAFKNTSISSIVFPESLTSIGAGAFEGCVKLKEIYLPETLKQINETAFPKSAALYVKKNTFAELLAEKGGYKYTIQ